MKQLETPARIEPCGIEEMIPADLSDLASDLRDAAGRLGHTLHPKSVQELRHMTRIMNAYYSNLIEGHKTRPRDIEAALNGHINNVEDRPLVEEAMAHIAIQDAIDEMAMKGSLPDPTSVAFIKNLHNKFYQEMPEELRFSEHDGLRQEIIPGMFRQSGQEVTVGEHYPPTAARLDSFMTHFEKRYLGLTRGATGKILSIPAAHHRLNYIHPFVDGNGRVSRLMSHAMNYKAGIAGQGLWSISRGLARGLELPAEYKDMMRMADHTRKGDRDGRGNLSLAALTKFTKWFLDVSMDQIHFSEIMFDLKTLTDRYSHLIKDLHPGNERLPKLVSHIIRHGEMARGDAMFVTGTKDRAARSDLSLLLKEGFIKSDTPKGLVRITFPIDYRERLFPNLFTDTDIVVPKDL